MTDPTEQRVAPVDLTRAADLLATARQDTSAGLVAREMLLPAVADMVAELRLARPLRQSRELEAAPEGANATLGQLNRALAEIDMPAAVLTIDVNCRSVYGAPMAVVRLERADDPGNELGRAYGVINIMLGPNEDDDDMEGDDA